MSRFVKEIVFATNNEYKLKEATMIVESMFPSPLGRIVGLKDVGIDIEVEETGTSYKENSLIKLINTVQAVHDGLDKAERFFIADDSGLEIDYLDGAPGLYSSRFMGEDTPIDEKIREILRRMEGVPKEKRTARYKTCIAACTPSSVKFTIEKCFEGFISVEPRGEYGFAYDKIFETPDGKTFAELLPYEKNKISQRAEAIRDTVRGFERLGGMNNI